LDENEPSPSSSKTEDLIDSVTGLVKAVPVYEDALQPAAKEVGKSLETVAKSINVALLPISGLIWGFDQLKDFVSSSVAHKLRNIPIERITTPSPLVAGPALDALKYAGHEESLREMYANLLATVLDSQTATAAHPAFVEVIRQLTPEEARILAALATRKEYPEVCSISQSLAKPSSSWLAYPENEEQFTNLRLLYYELCTELGFDSSNFTQKCLDNFQRQQLMEMTATYSRKKEPGFFAPVTVEEIDSENSEERDEKLRFTIFGRSFVQACVVEKA